MSLDDIPAVIREFYTDMRALPDGRIIGVHRLLFHWTLHIDIDAYGYGDRYCFATYRLAKEAFDHWQGEGDPEGWHRHPMTGRRRRLADDKSILAEWSDGMREPEEA